MGREIRTDYAKRCLSWYRRHIGVSDNPRFFWKTTIREILVLTTLVAIGITGWQYMYPLWIGDPPYEVFHDFSRGIAAFFDIHSTNP
jgi:hypothetical protein